MSLTETADTTLSPAAANWQRTLAGSPDITVDAAEIRRRWDQGQQAVRKLVNNYRLNATFTGGDQWVYFDEQTRTITQVPRQNERYRATMNIMLPAQRTVQAKMHRRPLKFDVVPTAADDATIGAARLAESILIDTSREHSWEELRAKGDLLAWQGGTAVLSVDWDTHAGTPIATDPVTGAPVSTGDTSEQVASIAQVAFPPGTRDAETAQWWIRALVMPCAEAKTKYGLDTEPQADGAATRGPGPDPLMRNVGDNVAGAKTCLVITYYERPSGDNPGQVSTVIANDVVESKPWPFPWDDRLNCAVIRESEIAETWAGDTVVTASLQAQFGFNAGWSNILEHLKLAGNARLAIDQDSMDLIEELTDTPAEILPIATNEKMPQWIAPAPLAQWIENLPTMIRNVYDDMVGTQEISRGASPSNIQSGLGLSILAEQADTPLAAFAMAAGRAWGRIASMVLKCYESEVTESRTARVDAPGMRAHNLTWNGDALMGQTTATVPADAVVPRSRAASQAFAARLWELQIVKDPHIFAMLADLPDQSAFLEALDPDTAKAERENHDLSLGVPCIPADFDNHRLHIDSHNRFCKSSRYENLPEMDQEMVRQHVQVHEQMAAAEASSQTLHQEAGMPELAAAAQATEPPGSAGQPPLLPPAPPEANLPQGTPPGENPAGSAMPPEADQLLNPSQPPTPEQGLPL